MNLSDFKDGLRVGLRVLAIIYMLGAFLPNREDETEESTNRLTWACLLLLLAMMD